MTDQEGTVIQVGDTVVHGMRTSTAVKMRRGEVVAFIQGTRRVAVRWQESSTPAIVAAHNLLVVG